MSGSAANATPLVGRTESQHLWLRGSGGIQYCYFSTLDGGAGAQGILSLVPTHWWVRLVPGLVLAYWWAELAPSVSGLQGPGVPRARVSALMFVDEP